MRLREYQEWAINALWNYFVHNIGNPLVLMPTGTGKSLVIAGFIRMMLWHYGHARVHVVTHVETLIAQNYEKMMRLWPQAPAGIYSAGLGRRDTFQQIIFGGIQSMYDRTDEFAPPDVLIIDEAHLVGPKDESMYVAYIKAMLARNPKMKVVGLTATDWRLGMGLLTDGGMFTDVAVDMTTPAAWNWFVDNGYLAKLSAKGTHYQLDDSNVGTVRGDYSEKDQQEQFDKEDITRRIVEEMVWWGQTRRMWMVFATGVKHCDHVADMLTEYGISAVSIHSKKKNAADLLAAWQANEYRAAVSMDKLTTGVDAPGVDMIGVLRLTKSSSKWVQMLGRGTRPLYADGFDLSTAAGRLLSMAHSLKPDGCLVLDFARNTERLGPINAPRISEPKGKKGKPGQFGAPVKMCIKCREYVPAGVRVCPVCHTEFPLVLKLEEEASTKEVMTRDAPEPVVQEFEVERVTYTYHKRKNSAHPPSLCVTYYAAGAIRAFQEYICFEHEGPPRTRAGNWWRERIPREWPRDTPVPDTVQQAREFVEHLRIPKAIRVWINSPRPRIMSYEYE